MSDPQDSSKSDHDEIDDSLLQHRLHSAQLLSTRKRKFALDENPHSLHFFDGPILKARKKQVTQNKRLRTKQDDNFNKEALSFEKEVERMQNDKLAKRRREYYQYRIPKVKEKLRKSNGEIREYVDGVDSDYSVFREALWEREELVREGVVGWINHPLSLLWGTNTERLQW